MKRAVDYIKRGASTKRPFFAYVSFSLMHMPTLLNPDFRSSPGVVQQSNHVVDLLLSHGEADPAEPGMAKHQSAPAVYGRGSGHFGSRGRTAALLTRHRGPLATNADLVGNQLGASFEQLWTLPALACGLAAPKPYPTMHISANGLSGSGQSRPALCIRLSQERRLA